MGPYLIIGIIAAVILFTIWQIVSMEKRSKAKNAARIQGEWGRKPERIYTREELDSICRSYERHKNSGLHLRGRFYIDDITWNDLDLDSIFMLLNNTQSSAGDEYVYRALRTPCFDERELRERDELADYFRENENIRFRVQMQLAKIGRTKRFSMTDYIDTFMNLHVQSNLTHIIPLIFLAISIAIIPFHVSGILAAIMILIYNVYTYYKAKSEIEPYFVCITYIVRLVKQAGDFCREFKDVKELQPYLKEMKEAAAKLSPIINQAFFIGGGRVSLTDSPAEMLMEYTRILTHIDIIQFNRILNKIQTSTTQVEQLTDCIGRLELSIAMASFREMLPIHTKPELLKTFKPENEEQWENGASYHHPGAEGAAHVLEVQDIYHPLIKEPVANSISEEYPVLLTGSNASGKSTFLKTLALSSILAQSIYTVTASRYRADYYRVYSSMSLRDNLEGEESYYMAEIRSLKRIVEASKETGAPVLCFVDEVLRGTNTVERIAASSQILKSLAKEGVMCFAATHDIELTYILSEYYHNYHFREEIADRDVIFNYVLYEGRSTTRNAIKLLEIMGYDKTIIENAEGAAKYFMEQGFWKNE